MGIVIHPKNSIIKWLDVDTTVTASVNAPLFGHIYLHLGIPTFLRCTARIECGPYFRFQ